MARANDRYQQAIQDEVITATERQEIEELIALTRQDVTTYRESQDAAADAFGNVLSTALGIAVVWATAGTATPFLVVALSAGGAGASGQVLGQVIISGQTYDVQRLPGDVFSGSINGATTAFSFGGLPSASTPFGRNLQGARAGFIEGSAGSFVGGISGALVQDGIWSEGVWRGLMRVGEAGLLSAGIGGLTGGLLGATLAPLWHLCFAAGTPVSTEFGLKPIEKIEAGDKVWAYNFRDGAWQLRPVVRPLAYDYAGDMITLEVAGETIDASGNHPFWVMEGEGLARRPVPEHVPALEPGNDTTRGRWVDARDLRIGDVFLLRSGKLVTVERLVARTDRLRVYNLHVEELHSYAVGNGEILVHNRLPRETEFGSWNGTRPGDGVYTTTHPDIRRALSPPGGPILPSVAIILVKTVRDLFMVSPLRSQRLRQPRSHTTAGRPRFPNQHRSGHREWLFISTGVQPGK